jgi:hypothetical protein
MQGYWNEEKLTANWVRMNVNTVVRNLNKKNDRQAIDECEDDEVTFHLVEDMELGEEIPLHENKVVVTNNFRAFKAYIQENSVSANAVVAFFPWGLDEDLFQGNMINKSVETVASQYGEIYFKGRWTTLLNIPNRIYANYVGRMELRNYMENKNHIVFSCFGKYLVSEAFKLPCIKRGETSIIYISASDTSLFVQIEKFRMKVQREMENVVLNIDEEDNEENIDNDDNENEDGNNENEGEENEEESDNNHVEDDEEDEEEDEENEDEGKEDEEVTPNEEENEKEDEKEDDEEEIPLHKLIFGKE